MFKYFFLIIGIFIFVIIIIFRFFPELIIKIIKKIFNKMYGIEAEKKPKKQQDIIIEKKKQKNETEFSDYEIVDENK